MAYSVFVGSVFDIIALDPIERASIFLQQCTQVDTQVAEYGRA